MALMVGWGESWHLVNVKTGMHVSPLCVCFQHDEVLPRKHFFDLGCNMNVIPHVILPLYHSDLPMISFINEQKVTGFNRECYGMSTG